jgi:hypothetical protein
MYALVSLYCPAGNALRFNRYRYLQDGLWVRLEEGNDAETL